MEQRLRTAQIWAGSVFFRDAIFGELWSIDSGLVGSTDFHGRGAARAEDAQGTPTQRHISPSILVHGESSIESCTEWYRSRFKNNCFAVMRSSSKVGSYLRLVDFLSLNSRPRVIKKKKKYTEIKFGAS